SPSPYLPLSPSLQCKKIPHSRFGLLRSKDLAVRVGSETPPAGREKNGGKNQQHCAAGANHSPINDGLAEHAIEGLQGPGMGSEQADLFHDFRKEFPREKAAA